MQRVYSNFSINNEKYILKQYQVNAEETRARRAFKEGMVLYGYCNGIFGEDSYEDKKITCIIGNYMEVENIEGNGTGFGIIKNWVELLESSNQEIEKREKYE